MSTTYPIALYVETQVRSWLTGRLRAALERPGGYFCALREVEVGPIGRSSLACLSQYREAASSVRSPGCGRHLDRSAVEAVEAVQAVQAVEAVEA
jgi:hypothetical protein